MGSFGSLRRDGAYHNAGVYRDCFVVRSPVTMAYTRECTVALELATQAAELIQRIYDTGFEVEWKGHQDPVTAADREANALLVAGLRKAFPDDAICAEEADVDESSREASRGGRCWFVDPLDGTKEFVQRNGEFCVMVGLAVNGIATLGVLVAPAWQRAWSGVVGEGAWEHLPDGTRRAMTVSPSVSPAPSWVSSRSHPSPVIEKMAEHMTLGPRRLCGSVGLKVTLVTCGEVDLYVHLGRGPKLWDGCAPEAVARAAGAEVTDAQGRALRYDTGHLPLDQGIVVATPALAARARHALAEVSRS